MKRHREDFFRQRRSHWLFRHLVGFAWKLEYGRHKGFHYHMLFFYDGAYVAQDLTRSVQLGRYWQEEITQGQGIFFNSNMKAASLYKNHPNNALGAVNHDDFQKVRALAKVLNYLTKSDEFITLTVAGKDRTFGRGSIPKPKTETRGRPRAHPSVKVPFDKDNPFVGRGRC